MKLRDEQWLDMQCLELVTKRYGGHLDRVKCEMAVELANTLRQARKESNARNSPPSATISPIKVING